MFLATTANQKFWKPDEAILFLGEWCRVYSQRHVWSELEHEVLAYHGRDRDALYGDYKYATNVYERILVQLTNNLNVLHGSNYSVRYWRIVLGPWLVHFIEILLDRYRSICVAVDSGKVTGSWITPEFPAECVPADFSQFRQWFVGDAYNHCLYSQIIKSMGNIPWEAKEEMDFSAFRKEKKSPSAGGGFKKSVIELLGAFSRVIPEPLQKVVMVESYIKPVDIMRLQILLGVAPCPYRPEVKIAPTEADWEMRRKIKLGQGENCFESILKECIPLQIPRIYVEGYAGMARRGLAAFPKNPKVILTSNAYKANEGFKFWAAGQVERGVKLVVTQHGGHVGDGLWSTDDDHEIKIADRYFTWGWTRTNESKTVPMPSSMLASGKDCLPDPDGPILCVPCSFPRYPYLMFSVPQGPLVLEMIKFQERFFKSASPQVHSLCEMRLFPYSGWDEKLRWLDSAISPRIYQGNKSYYDHLSISRLCICFYNGTPFLETFAANYPTLLCWDPNYTELNESARPYFDRLREAGILHDTPGSATSKLNEIYQNPRSWWMSLEVQDAKNKFCDQFVRTNPDWLAQWKGELLKLMREGHEEV